MIATKKSKMDVAPAPEMETADFTQRSNERFSFSMNNTAAVEKYKDLAKNANTEKSTKKWLRCYRNWAVSKGAPEVLEVIPPRELDEILQVFFAEVTRRDGGGSTSRTLSARCRRE